MHCGRELMVRYLVTEVVERILLFCALILASILGSSTEAAVVRGLSWLAETALESASGSCWLCVR